MGMWWGVPSLPSIAMHEGMLGIDRNESPLEKKTKKTNFNEKWKRKTLEYGGAIYYVPHITFCGYF